jgi:MFS family permease
MIGDVAEPNKRQEAISTMFLFSSFGMLIGPMICSSLLPMSGISLRNIYQIVIVAQIFLVIYILVQVHETKVKTPDGHKLNYRGRIMELIQNRNFQALLVMSFFFSLSRSIIQTYIPVYAKTDLHLSNAEVASFSIFSNLAVMIIRFLSATLLTRFQSGATLISVQIIGGAAGLLSPLANSFVSIVLVLFISGISYGAERILSTVLVANNSKSQNRGVANSVFNVSQSVGGMSKVLTTSLVEASGFVPALIVGGVVGFATIIPPLLHRPLMDSLRTPSPETLPPIQDGAESEGQVKARKPQT